jgi:phosphoserine phosphatase
MKRNLAIFDLDNTILNGDSDYSWINFLIKLSMLIKKNMRKKISIFMINIMRGI